MISKFLLVTALLTQVHTQAPNIATVATVLMHRSLLQYGRDTVTPNAVWDEEIKKEFIQKIEEIFNGPIQRAFEDPSLSSKVNIKIAKRRYIFLNDRSFYFNPDTMNMTFWKTSLDSFMPANNNRAAIVGIPILIIGRDPSKPDPGHKIGISNIGGWIQGCNEITETSNIYSSSIIDGSGILGNRFAEISTIMTHELGHFFGANHDDPNLGCNTGNHDSIMAPSRQKMNIVTWPECVVNGIYAHVNDPRLKNGCSNYAQNVDSFNFDWFQDRWEIPDHVGPMQSDNLVDHDPLISGYEKRDTVRFLEGKRFLKKSVGF